MSLISIPNTFTVGAVIVASQHNSNFSVIYSDYNGNIDNSNLASSANISDTKLGQITTAGKVSGAALTSLSSIPSGAGHIPIVNLASGTPDGTKFIKDDGTLAVPSQTGLGSWASKSDNTVYQAATDGFFVGIITAGSTTSAGKVVAYTDGSNPPTTIRGSGIVIKSTGTISETSTSDVGSFCIPVKKNDYYKGVLTESHSGTAATATYYFIPLGT